LITLASNPDLPIDTNTPVPRPSLLNRRPTPTSKPPAAWLDDLDLSTPSKGNQWYTLLRRGRKPEDFAALKKTFDAQVRRRLRGNGCVVLLLHRAIGTVNPCATHLGPSLPDGGSDSLGGRARSPYCIPPKTISTCHYVAVLWMGSSVATHRRCIIHLINRRKTVPYCN
jgi:hypothetical protein